MRRKKIIGRLAVVLEVVLLAGMVLFSFYLLLQYMEAGEQAVSGTSVVTETGELEGESEKEKSEKQEMELIQSFGEDSALIRVRILDDDYEKDLFEKITVTASEGFTAERGTYDEAYNFESDREKDTFAAYGEEESLTVAEADLQTGEALRLRAAGSGVLTVTSLKRADGSPEYEGELYIYCLEGGLALVNVLELEKYLYAAVSSEMPSYFPIEALKAQAVCARTYAVLCINENKNKNSMADLDDSVRFQVYNNRRSTDASREAVDATRQEILSVKKVQYYSTSCLSEQREDLDKEQAFRAFLAEIPDESAEYGSAWVRWEAEIPVPQILDRLAETYGIQADTLEEISVESRSGNGQALLLRVAAGGETVEIEGEYAIRQFLSPAEAGVELMDGTAVSGLQLLPSAFFWLELEEYALDGENIADNMAAEEDILHIYGGGYGHGNGMSQYGAAQMAEEGASYLEILEYYYAESG
ncbi:MAG: SpoIID/LytB domain-containing protein [Lachnospiraceae bacterium]|nr:SpoIID/LytB domain-containing protein [Lachnospiraceae bacterium]